MKTRTLVLVVLALLLLGSCSPKEADVPAIGDLFVKLGRNETLTPGEIDTLRLEMNRMQSVASKASVALDMAGAGLSPDVFRNSGMFSTLPHEVASMRFDTQTIPNNSATPPTSLATSNATWAYGFRLDTTNHRIYTTGRPGEMLLLVVAWWQWGINATGNRILTWNTDDGGSVNDRRASFGGSLGTYNYIANVRRVVSGESYHYLTVFQDSGGDLSGDGLLTVTRLR